MPSNSAYVRCPTPARGARSSVADSSAIRSAPLWRFVDRFGTEWRVYDRVRWALSQDRAEFRFVPPGHRDTRSRLFVRADRVVFELCADDPAWVVFSPIDLSDRTLNRQIFAARRSGPSHVPSDAPTTPAPEMRQFARDYARGIPQAIHAGATPRPQTESGSRHVATHARPSERGFRVYSLCNPLGAVDA
jgi:hypothetical protein